MLAQGADARMKQPGNRRGRLSAFSCRRSWVMVVGSRSLQRIRSQSWCKCRFRFDVEGATSSNHNLAGVCPVIEEWLDSCLCSSTTSAKCDPRFGRAVTVTKVPFGYVASQTIRLA